MAQTKKKSTKSRASEDARACAKTSEVKPRRREIAALIFLFLGIFAFIGYFKDEAVFIHWFCWLFRVLTGWGFFLLPPVLLMCAWILAFHHGRPVTLRLVCTLLLPVAAGGLY